MFKEGGPGWSGRENLFTLERAASRVECEFCGKRALVPFDRLKGRRSDMTPIKHLPLRCGCGSRN